MYQKDSFIVVAEIENGQVKLDVLDKWNGYHIGRGLVKKNNLIFFNYSNSEFKQKWSMLWQDVKWWAEHLKLDVPFYVDKAIAYTTLNKPYLKL